MLKWCNQNNILKIELSMYLAVEWRRGLLSWYSSRRKRSNGKYVLQDRILYLRVNIWQFTIHRIYSETSCNTEVFDIKFKSTVRRVPDLILPVRIHVYICWERNSHGVWRKMRFSGGLLLGNALQSRSSTIYV